MFELSERPTAQRANEPREATRPPDEPPRASRFTGRGGYSTTVTSSWVEGSKLSQ
jgi:hypothetical protein